MSGAFNREQTSRVVAKRLGHHQQHEVEEKDHCECEADKRENAPFPLVEHLVDHNGRRNSMSPVHVLANRDAELVSYCEHRLVEAESKLACTIVRLEAPGHYTTLCLDDVVLVKNFVKNVIFELDI